MIRQCSILFGCLALGELIVYLTGIKLPSSIIGMLLLTLFLQLGWIKLEWVQGLTNFLVANLGFFFVPSGVALMLYFDVITAQFWPIVIATLVSTILVLVVTGWVHQLVRKYGFFENKFFCWPLRLAFSFCQNCCRKNWMGAIESYPCGNSYVNLFSSVYGGFL